MLSAATRPDSCIQRISAPDAAIAAKASVALTLSRKTTNDVATAFLGGTNDHTPAARMSNVNPPATARPGDVFGTRRADASSHPATIKAGAPKTIIQPIS